MLLDADPLTQATTWMEGAAKWGLGIVLAILVLILLYMVIRSILRNVDKDREAYMKLLNTRDEIITNHLDHVEQNVGKMEVTLTGLIVSSNKNTDRIVDAIDNQTKIIKGEK